VNTDSSSELVEEYLRWLVIERGRLPATIESYRRDLVRFTEWVARADLTVTRLSAQTIDKYLAAMRRDALAPSSVNRALAAIRGWCAYLVDEGVLQLDPTAKVGTPRRARSLPKPLSESDTERLISAAVGDTPLDLRDRALIELLYGTGVRVSEAIGVELQHLDFDEDVIRVTGKGDRQRLVPIGAELRVALVDYLSPGGRGELVGAASKSFLFLNARGGRLTRQGVDLVLRHRALLAGIDSTSVSAHVLRHSCATHMLAHGADVRVVQELLGHASIATTQIYTGVSLTTLKAAYDQSHPRAQDHLAAP
jgi:integrase/recombinase XerD